MKLVSLTLEAFRGVPDGTYAFTHPTTGAPQQQVMIAGPMGSGKTSFLEAIAALKESIAPYAGRPNAARLLRRGASRGRIAGCWLLTAEEVVRAELQDSTLETELELGENVVPTFLPEPILELFAQYDHSSRTAKFEYFPANRRLLGRVAAESTNEAFERRVRLAKPADKYAGVVPGMIAAALAGGMRAAEELNAAGVLLKSDHPDALASYKRSLAELAPRLRLVSVRTEDSKGALVFERADGVRPDLEDLSEGEQQALLFAGTFHRIGLSGSIVLIDVPELHLASEEHSRFLRAVLALGTDNQVFFATGSADLLAGVSPALTLIKLGPKAR